MTVLRLYLLGFEYIVISVISIGLMPSNSLVQVMYIFVSLFVMLEYIITSINKDVNLKSITYRRVTLWSYIIIKYIYVVSMLLYSNPPNVMKKGFITTYLGETVMQLVAFTGIVSIIFIIVGVLIILEYIAERGNTLE